jgi:hypothetical protein
LKVALLLSTVFLFEVSKDIFVLIKSRRSTVKKVAIGIVLASSAFCLSAYGQTTGGTPVNCSTSQVGIPMYGGTAQCWANGNYLSTYVPTGLTSVVTLSTPFVPGQPTYSCNANVPYLYTEYKDVTRCDYTPSVSLIIGQPYKVASSSPWLINYTATATDSDGQIVSYEWTIPGAQGAAETQFGSSTATRSFGFGSKPTSTTVILKVKDDDGYVTTIQKSVTF